jgi:predicted phosphodiesterase
MKLGFISDIHEDIQSLEKAFRILAKENCDSILCLGDIVGFTLPFYRYIDTRNAEDCIRLIKENCSLSVIGNHDLYAIKKIPEHKAGFNYDDNWYQLDYEIRAKKARNRIWLYEDNEIKTRLSDTSKEFLSNLNEVEFYDAGGFGIMISHFCYPDFSGSAIFFPGEIFHLEKHFDFMKNSKATLSFSGHGHPDGAIWVNDDNFRSLKFGSYRLSDNLNWIVIPCIARTTRANGLLILDTCANEFKVISLSNSDS